MNGVALTKAKQRTAGANWLMLCPSFPDIGKGGLFSIADLHAADTEEATLCRGLCYLLADATQPSLEGRCIPGCLGIKDCGDLPQIRERNAAQLRPAWHL